MDEIFKKLKTLGLDVPNILLPKSSSLEKWPVIACDQFTQDRDYWVKAKAFTAGSPSALNLIFPEIFLAGEGAEQRISDIHSNMKHYLANGVFEEPRQGFIYIERDTPYQKKRRGLLAAIDLEQYDWLPDARPLIRCTEGTVPERLPPRMDIRRGASLELPHVLLLIDDDTDSLLPALAERVTNSAPVYNTPLMMDSGSVTGWFVDTSDDLAFIAGKLDELCKRSLERYRSYEHYRSSERFGVSQQNSGNMPFLFAVGDGNHSLAAAKGIWEEYKAKGFSDHPCRYALVEIENLYDPAIQFEPIHRLVFGACFDKVVSILSQLPDFSLSSVESAKELVQLCTYNEASGRLPAVAQPLAVNRFGIISSRRYALIETSASGIATACLQPLLDAYAGDNPQLIDYIHDEDEILRLSGGSVQSEENSVGILLPPVQKSGLFETVARIGPLPRKSFSMGHSCEKRFYLECRSLL